MGSESVIVARFAYRHEAEIARGFLENADIPCVIFVDDAGGAEPQLAYINGVRVVVPAAFAERARQVLTDAGMLDDGTLDEEDDVIDIREKLREDVDGR